MISTIRNGSKRTISASGKVGVLQMVSEPNTGRYASEDIELLKWVDCETLHWLERGTKHFLKLVETSKHFLEVCGNLFLVDAF